MKFLILLLISFPVYADSEHTCQGNSCNDGTAQPQEQVQDQSQGQDQTASAIAEGSTAESTTGDSQASITNSYPEQAPDITLIPPLSTAPCIRGFGFGLSASEGAVVLGPTWKDGDCMAINSFSLLSELGLHSAAATVYCARGRFSKPFGSVEDCEKEVTVALTPKPVMVADVTEEEMAELRAQSNELARELEELRSLLMEERQEDRVRQVQQVQAIQKVEQQQQPYAAIRERLREIPRVKSEKK